MVVVKDTSTGMKLDCKIRYSMSCTVKVIDEKTYNFVTAAESFKDILYKYIDVCLGACFREAYPDGVEYQDLPANVQKVNDSIKNKTAGILASNGIAMEELVIERIVLEENEKNMFERMRSMKAGINHTVPNRNVASGEWICVCGNRNSRNFCTECGSPRK